MMLFPINNLGIEGDALDATLQNASLLFSKRWRNTTNQNIQHQNTQDES